jgi:hypothetical protein
MSDRRDRMAAELLRRQEGPDLPHFGDWRDLLRGLRGSAGEPGARGSSGAPGRTGDTGAQGLKGDAGVTNMVFGSHTIEGLGSVLAAIGTGVPVSSAWPTASLAMFVPIALSEAVTVVKMAWLNGATVSGNVDVGIYDASGNRLVSIGSTAQAGVTNSQVVDIADTLLNAGRYYLALAVDNITGTMRMTVPDTLGTVKAMGMLQMAAAFPLPLTATFAAAANTRVPQIWASQSVNLF